MCVASFIDDWLRIRILSSMHAVIMFWRTSYGSDAVFSLLLGYHKINVTLLVTYTTHSSLANSHLRQNKIPQSLFAELRACTLGPDFCPKLNYFSLQHNLTNREEWSDQGRDLPRWGRLLQERSRKEAADGVVGSGVQVENNWNNRGRKMLATVIPSVRGSKSSSLALYYIFLSQWLFGIEFYQTPVKLANAMTN